jgi:hypothetical protein
MQIYSWIESDDGSRGAKLSESSSISIFNPVIVATWSPYSFGDIK